ncbi:hypothetical protein [Streptomyces minutiscleroticus]|uniref:hypothetical protein n=1 Tax=Streptomyces minutiscleroticus TaxID=68238 RepID=UPI0033258F5F
MFPEPTPDVHAHLDPHPNCNGHQDDPQFLTYTVTDPHGRRWSISPATGNQTTPSKPGHVWEASCASTLHRTAITTAQGAAATICEHPA